MRIHSYLKLGAVVVLGVIALAVAPVRPVPAAPPPLSACPTRACSGRRTFQFCCAPVTASAIDSQGVCWYNTSQCPP